MRIWLPVLAVLTLTLAPAGARARTHQLLPDLDQAPVGCPGGYSGDPMKCQDWDVCMVADASNPGAACHTSGTIQAVRLRFTSSEDNLGAGPLLFYGQRRPGRAHMTVRQALATSKGALPATYKAAQVGLGDPTRNFVYYEPAQAHRHWHLMNFEHFQLRAIDGHTVVGDRKNGVCLGDRYATARYDKTNHPGGTNSPIDALSRELRTYRPGVANTYNCHRGQTPKTSILGLREGISVGYGDDYDYRVDYQWLDLTHVPSGQYVVVNEVNASHALREKRYGNNAASILVSIQWPGDAVQPPDQITEPPVVTMLASCPDSATCAPKAAPARAGVRARVGYGAAYNCPLHDELLRSPVTALR